MIKWLVVIGVIWAVYYFLIKKKPSVSQKTKNAPQEAQDMVECATCSVYVELNEAILSNGKYYCSQECIDKGN
jgi:uncharacterized protein